MKDIQNGGVLIGFSSKDEEQRFEERGTAKLGGNYAFMKLKIFNQGLKLLDHPKSILILK